MLLDQLGGKGLAETNTASSRCTGTAEMEKMPLRPKAATGKNKCE
jgi:hypothetical protein